MKTILTLTQILAVILIGLWGYFFFQFNPNTGAILYGGAMLLTGIIIGIALVANNLKTKPAKLML